MCAYDFRSIEPKWQKFWIENGLFEPFKDSSLKKKYILSMLPYPSGPIHMGHVRNYCIGDALSRFYKKKGFNVLNPIGWDAFGMPAENAAIKRKIHPKEWTYNNINTMREELSSLGISFSKKREFETCDKKYIEFEQRFIIEFYKNNLLYRKKAEFNWCDSCQTVLANEQVIDGACWRCSSKVVQKEMIGYYAKITDYAEELLDDIKLIEKRWPNRVVAMQKNWIGKSYGLEFFFNISEHDKKLLKNKFKRFLVFTTRPDTIYGVTYVALSPKHRIVDYMLKNSLLSKDAEDTILDMRMLNQKDITIKPKEGVPINIKAIHPLTKEELPVWVGNFVLSDYGDGAVMSVPAHDKRDFDFAKKYNIPIKKVIKDIFKNGEKRQVLVNSAEFNNLSIDDAQKSIIKYFQENNLGNRKIQYKLRDWCISRQRYWGSPIPFIHCPSCGVVPEDIENLPILLPDDVDITGEGNPLAKHPKWKYCKCPKCGQDALRETDTLDTFVQSSWYFLRYTDEQVDLIDQPFKRDSIDYWMPIDRYIGGIEHAILHLLYARFFTKALKDLGYFNFKEPFSSLFTQGMVLKDGAKMSKSRGNVVKPDEIISKFGADTLRLFILFAAPSLKELEWNDRGLEGAYRFINKLYENAKKIKNISNIEYINTLNLTTSSNYARKKVYEALQKSSRVYQETLSINTLIASCMEALNAILAQEDQDVLTEGYYIILNLLEPVIPHISWELSDKYFKKQNLIEPIRMLSLSEDKSVNVQVAINGKKRAIISIKRDFSREDIIQDAKASVQKWLTNKNIVKTIFIPNKLVNFVLGQP